METVTSSLASLVNLAQERGRACPIKTRHLRRSADDPIFNACRVLGELPSAIPLSINAARQGFLWFSVESGLPCGPVPSGDAGLTSRNVPRVLGVVSCVAELVDGLPNEVRELVPCRDPRRNRVPMPVLSSLRGFAGLPPTRISAPPVLVPLR